MLFVLALACWWEDAILGCRSTSGGFYWCFRLWEIFPIFFASRSLNFRKLPVMRNIPSQVREKGFQFSSNSTVAESSS